MSAAREKLERLRGLHLIRENRELALQAARKNSALTKPMVDLGTTENPVPSRPDNLSEAQGEFDQVEESFFDKTDLLDWVDDLVDGWGVEPDFAEVWAAMEKEPRKFSGFANNLGLGLMRQIVQTEVQEKARPEGEDFDWEESENDRFLEEEDEKPWKKSRKRRKERQKEIQNKVLEETSADLESNASDVMGALVDSEDAHRKLEDFRAIVSGSDPRVDQKTKFAIRDAKQLILSVKGLVHSLRSGVVAEGKKMTKKTNLEMLLEQHMDTADDAGVDTRLAERIQKVLSLIGEEGTVEDIAGLLRYASEDRLHGLHSAVLKLELMADRISNAVEALGRQKDTQRYGRRG